MLKGLRSQQADARGTTPGVPQPSRDPPRKSRASRLAHGGQVGSKAFQALYATEAVAPTRTEKAGAGPRRTSQLTPRSERSSESEEVQFVCHLCCWNGQALGTWMLETDP